MLQRLPRLSRPTAPDPIRQDLFGDDGRFRGWVLAFLAANVVVGLLLRTVAIGQESLWYDEAASMKMAAASPSQIFSGEVFDAGNPPLYFILLGWWCDVFGHTIEAARWFAAVCGAVTCVPTWLLCMSVGFHRRLAVIATTLVTINPALVYLGREARTFTLAATLVTVLAYVAIRLVRRTRMIDWCLFFLCGTALVFLHYYSLFLMIIISLPILAGRRRHLHKTLPALSLVAAAMFVPFMFWMPMFVKQMSIWSAPDVPWWKHALYFPVYVVGGRTFVWKQDGLMWMGAAFGLVLFGVLIPVIAGLRRSPRSIGVPLIVGVGLAAVAVMMSVLKEPMFNCRYLAPTIPCLIVAAVVSIAWLHQSHRWVAPMAGGIAFCVPLVAIPRIFLETQKNDWRGVAMHVEAAGDAAMPIAFRSDIGELSYRYYDPDRERIELRSDFQPESKSDRMDRYRKQLADDGEFWVAHCMPAPESSVPPAQRWLEYYFDLVERHEFRGITLERYRTPADSETR